MAANANAPSGSYPVYNTAGQLVSVGNTIYSGSLANAVGYDQFGNPANYPVWTGSNSDGSAATGHTLGTASPGLGNPVTSDTTWLNNGTIAAGSPGISLYALSGPITNNVAAAGGGTGTVGGVSATFANVTSPGVFTSTYSAVANDPTDLTNALGATAYAALRSSVYFPPSPSAAAAIRFSCSTWDSQARALD